MTYTVSNSEYQSAVDGIRYRRSMKLADKITGKVAAFGDTVQGQPVGSNWVKVDHGQFLPVFLQSRQVLFAQTNVPSTNSTMQ